jgi:hypothetical protein
MNDFLIGLGVAVGATLLLSKYDSARLTAMQQQSCTALGGQWDIDACTKAGQPIATQYTMISPWILVGVPFAAAVLSTRSLGGFLGAGAGTVGVFFYAISEIH